MKVGVIKEQPCCLIYLKNKSQASKHIILRKRLWEAMS